MAEIIQMEESFAGVHIATACENAAKLAAEKQQPVRFVFNGTEVIAQPDESADTLQVRWTQDYEAAAEAYRNSPEYKAQQEKWAREAKEADEAVLICTAGGEKDMREDKVPSIRTEKQLHEYIASLVNRRHDYGTCVYALSMAATAAFEYVAHKLGVSGFQASCADLDILRRTRRMDGPFMIVRAEDALYPQYDLQGRLTKTLDEWKPWLKEEAQKKIAESSQDDVHPDVWRHWLKLAA